MIVESLANIYPNILHFYSDYNYDLKVVKQEIIEDEVVLIGEGKYWRDTGWEQDTQRGPMGQFLTLNVGVDLQQVAEELSKDLNEKAKSFLSGKILPAGILKSLKEGSYLNAVAMFIKQEIKKSKVEFTGEDIEDFLVNHDLDKDYVSLNRNLEKGEQYLAEAFVTFKDVDWSGNKLNFLFDVEVLYDVSGYREDDFDPPY